MKSIRLLIKSIGKVTGPPLCIAAIAVWLIPAFHNRWRVEAAGRCSDVPLRVTLYNTALVDPATGTAVTTALQSDGLGEYVNGIGGSVLIKVCAGTNDAVLNVTSTKRAFSFQFPAPLEGSVIDSVPVWVPGRNLVSGWISVRNITFSKQPFTTRVGSTFTTASDRATYRLGFMPVGTDAPDIHTGDLEAALDNTPYPTSPAMVYPSYPQACGAGNMPTWLVRGTTTNSAGQMQVAALHKVPNKGAQVHEGQYSMPFEMRIDALQCFPY